MESSSQDREKSSSDEEEEEDDETPELSKNTSESVVNKPNESNPEYSSENIHYEGPTAIYTDPASKYQYQWNETSKEWVPRGMPAGVTYGFENDTHIYTDADGAKYFWDKDKQAWFPKVDDEFIAQYQLNYGFIDNTTPAPEAAQPEQSKEPPKKPEKRKPSEPSWFEVDEQQNNKVYVSNLPLDITEQEFIDTMQKCGLIMRDPASGKMKIKLYTERDSDQLKGDGLCTYIKIESVDLALNLLDGSDLRGKKLKVERAKFQMKGAYDPKLKPKKKKKKELEKIRRRQEKLFDWRPEKMRGERAKHERVVILKNVFDSTIFDRDLPLILEYQQDLRDECKKCGEVKRVVIYDRHSEGVAQVTMKTPEEADEVVKLLHNRWFGKRQISAELWDGKTKYKSTETDEDFSKRIDNWDKFLEEEEAKGGQSQQETVTKNQDSVS